MYCAIHYAWRQIQIGSSVKFISRKTNSEFSRLKLLLLSCLIQLFNLDIYILAVVRVKIRVRVDILGFFLQTFCFWNDQWWNSNSKFCFQKTNIRYNCNIWMVVSYFNIQNIFYRHGEDMYIYCVFPGISLNFSWISLNYMQKMHYLPKQCIVVRLLLWLIRPGCYNYNRRFFLDEIIKKNWKKTQK